MLLLQHENEDGFFQNWFPPSPQAKNREQLQIFFRRAIRDLREEKTFGTAPLRTRSCKLWQILDDGCFEYDLTNMYVENYESRDGKIPMPTELTCENILYACYCCMADHKKDSGYLYNFGISLTFFVIPLLSRRRGMAEPLCRLFGVWVDSLEGIDEDDWETDYRLVGMSLAMHLKPNRKAVQAFKEPFCRYIDLVPDPHDNWCQVLFAVQSMAALGIRKIRREIDAAVELAIPYLDSADMLGPVLEKLQTYRNSI